MELYTENLTIAYPSETIDQLGKTVWVCSEPRKYPAGQKNATEHNINWNLNCNSDGFYLCMRSSLSYNVSLYRDTEKIWKWSRDGQNR